MLHHCFPLAEHAEDAVPPQHTAGSSKATTSGRTDAKLYSHFESLLQRSASSDEDEQSNVIHLVSSDEDEQSNVIHLVSSDEDEQSNVIHLVSSSSGDEEEDNESSRSAGLSKARLHQQDEVQSWKPAAITPAAAAPAGGKAVSSRPQVSSSASSAEMSMYSFEKNNAGSDTDVTSARWSFGEPAFAKPAAAGVSTFPGAPARLGSASVSSSVTTASGMTYGRRGDGGDEGTRVGPRVTAAVYGGNHHEREGQETQEAARGRTQVQEQGTMGRQQLHKFKEELENCLIDSISGFKKVRDYLQVSSSSIPFSGTGRTYEAIRQDLLQEIEKRLSG